MKPISYDEYDEGVQRLIDAGWDRIDAEREILTTPKTEGEEHESNQSHQRV